MSILKSIKSFVEDLIPNVDELASVMFPDNVGNLFEPLEEISIHELERKYFNKPILM